MIQRLASLFATVVFGVVLLPVSSAQTPQQIEQFKQLPLEQQRQLLEQYRQGSAVTVKEPKPTEPTTVIPTDAPPAPAPPVRDAETGLPMFGYDLFAGVPTTFAPVTDIPIPVDFRMGPGDMVVVQLFGKVVGNYTLAVNRDGAINFPELGPITVIGLTFDEMRKLLQERVTQQMIGVTASISLGELRSIRVFVLGEAERPGSYTVSSLSTITNALFVSGGVRKIGSLRNIQLKRQGRLIRTLDLYDLLLRGDTSDDARLQPGDVIFIPPAGTQVGIRGEVRRAAVYEVRGPANVGDLIGIAGGLLPAAYPQRASLSRINEARERVIEDLDLQTTQDRARKLRAGDLITVPSVLERIEKVVRLEGHVLRPGPVEFRAGMRLTDLIRSLDELKPMPDARYVLIRRELGPDRRVVAVSADLEAALRERRGPADVALMARDQVRVFDLSGSRPDVGALVNELRIQASLDQAAPEVRVSGRVRAPGVYPLEPGMRVSALLRAGGQLTESAYVTEAEVTRYEVVNGEYREIGLLKIDLAAIRSGSAGADLALQPYDFLNVRAVTDWREQATVAVQGEVRFPGSYPIRKGETLLSVIGRAGGLTDQAYAHGAVFTRVRLRQREEEQIRQLAERMEADLAMLSLQQAQTQQANDADPGAATMAVGRSLLSDLRRAKPIGRLAMDLPRIMAMGAGNAEDVVVEAGDVLMIPGKMQSVTVLGEVYSPTSLLFQPELDRTGYINLSGGLTRRADAKRVYVVHANGQVSAAGKRGWGGDAGPALRPGDTIVVPADVERMRALPLWSGVTQILYNVAVSVAAVNSF